MVTHLSSANKSRRWAWGFTACALAVALSGCTSLDTGGKVWYKPNGTTDERDRLLAAAQVQAQQAHLGTTLATSDTAESKHQSELETTMTYMTAHGWQLVPPDQAKPLKASASTDASSPSTSTATGAVGLDR